jgi:hypothetical protein
MLEITQVHAREPLSWLLVDRWDYSTFFDPNEVEEGSPSVEADVESLVAETALQKHAFFERALSNRSSLALWVTQELVMTNAFSQLVLCAAAACPNVHARAVLTEIAFGEHGRFRDRVAKDAHPWLLDQLRQSIGLPRQSVYPMAPTIAFIERLGERIADPLEAVAFIGVGNERLIVPEYEAIERCFCVLWPEATFAPFLEANLTEDVWHSKLCYILADTLICNLRDRERFLCAAREAVTSRVQYFDELLELDICGQFSL